MFFITHKTCFTKVSEFIYWSMLFVKAYRQNFKSIEKKAMVLVIIILPSDI